jgi:site-specific DNA-methyltransferase (adenine-specific)
MNTFIENTPKYIGSLSDDDTEYTSIARDLEECWVLEKDEFIKTYLKVTIETPYMSDMFSNINGIIKDTDTELTKLSKAQLLSRCKEVGIINCTSKNKNDLINLIKTKSIPTQKVGGATIESIEKCKTNTIEEEQNTNQPYSKLEINTTNYNIINGDCLTEMKNIEEKTVDMILCDLPYGMTKNSWDVLIPFDKLWNEYNRIIKDNGAIVLFGSQPFTSLMITSNLTMFRYCLVWEKNKFSDFLNSKRKPMKTNEDIAIFYKKQPIYNPQYWYSTPYTRWNTQNAVDKQSNYGTHKENYVKSDGKRLPTTVLKFNRVERPLHPTQKPTDLLEWLIKTYTNDNDLVLDNCMGVGSTGIACKNISRRFIGIELEYKYYEIAKNNIFN